MARESRHLPWLIAALLLSACASDTTEADPCTHSAEVLRPTGADIDEVDLLLMMDDSQGTLSEQALLIDQLPRLIEALSMGDADPSDGLVFGRDFSPVRSIQVGVVTSDMGTHGFEVPTCTLQPHGEDGILRDGSWDGSCSGPSFLSFNPITDDLEAFANEMRCVASVGSGGCGLEQPLEAILKAVTPSSRGPTGAFDGSFADRTLGHADGENAGFLRPDAVLAIVALTDEDDCSALDPSLYDVSNADYGDVPLSLRCFAHPEALQPIERYVDGLLAGRSADRLVFSVLAGIPADAEPAVGERPDYEAILAHPDMQQELDPDQPMRLRPSCNEAGSSFAFPPRRMVEVARGLDARGVSTAVASLCAPDYTNAIDAILRAIATPLVSCIGPRTPRLDADRRLPCELIETLPTGEDAPRCDTLPARVHAGYDPLTGAEECRIEQLATEGLPPEGEGWYVDTFSPAVLRRCGESEQPARLVLSPDLEIAGYTRFECTARTCP